MRRRFQDDDYFVTLIDLGSNIKGYIPGSIIYTGNSAIALANTQLKVFAVYIPEAAPITNFNTFIQTRGVYVSTGYNGVGLYSKDITTGVLTLIASSTTSTTIWASPVGLLTVPFSVPITLPTGVYFLATLYQRSSETTAPALYMQAAGSLVVGMDFPNSLKLTAVENSITSLPATISSTTLTATTNVPYCFLS